MTNEEKLKFLKYSYVNSRTFELIPDHEKDTFLRAWAEEILTIAPTHLYKYRACNENNLKMLRNRTAWFSCPSTWNDPIDVTVSYDLDKDLQMLQDNIDKIVTKIAFTLVNQYIESFCEQKKFVTADEVKAELAKMQEQNSRMVSVEKRAVKKNDTAVIDFEGFVDGVAFDGGKAEKYELVIGSGSFIPGFEDQIIGHKVGEEFDVNVTFPAEYQENLASKDAVFKIKLHEIKVKELPALDDEFAKDVSEFDTLDELKKSVKAQLEDAKKADADNKVINDLLEEVVKGMEVDVPAVMIEAEIDNIVDNFNYRLQSQGLDLNTYLSYTGMEMEAFRDGYKENAEAQVKLSLAIEAIVKAENIEATEDEVNAEYENLAKTYNMDVEAVKKAIPTESLAGDIKSKKAIDLVKESAKVTEEKATKKAAEKKEGEEKAPAKKTATKKTTKKAEDAE